MKIKHILLYFAVSVITFCSCSEALDTVPEGNLTYDEIFADNDKVRSVSEYLLWDDPCKRCTLLLLVSWSG